jgi:hypothetical protein
MRSFVKNEHRGLSELTGLSPWLEVLSMFS